MKSVFFIFLLFFFFFNFGKSNLVWAQTGDPCCTSPWTYDANQDRCCYMGNCNVTNCPGLCQNNVCTEPSPSPSSPPSPSPGDTCPDHCTSNAQCQSLPYYGSGYVCDFSCGSYGNCVLSPSPSPSSTHSCGNDRYTCNTTTYCISQFGSSYHCDKSCDPSSQVGRCTIGPLSSPSPSPSSSEEKPITILKPEKCGCEDHIDQNCLAAGNTPTECRREICGIMTALGCFPTEPSAIIQWILRYAIMAAGGIGFLLMLFASFQIMTSAGDPEKLKNGQQMLTSAITGILLVVFSLFILKFIGADILKIPGWG